MSKRALQFGARLGSAAVLTWLLCFPGTCLAQDTGAAARLLIEAEGQSGEGDWESAERSYGLVVDQFPGSQEAAEALLRLAQGRLARGEADKAEEAARALVEGYAASPRAAGGWVLLGDLARQQADRLSDLEEARELYRTVLVRFGPEAYPLLSWRSRAAVESARLACLLGAEDEAAALYLEVLEREPATIWSKRAGLGLASVLLGQRSWVEAADLLQEVVGLSVEDDEAENWAARSMLGRVHRLHLRPAAGRARWEDVSLLTVAGTELKKPRGVAAAEDGRLLVVDDSGPTVIEIDREGRVGRRWGVRGAARPAWTAAGQPLVPTESVLAFPESGAQRRLDTPPADKKPELEPLLAATGGPLGRWYVASAKPDRVLSYDRSFRYAGPLMDDDEGEPVDLATDGKGRIHVLDAKGERVIRYNAEGRRLGVVAGGKMKKPEALAVDPEGNLFVIDRAGPSILLFDPEGTLLETLGPDLPGGVSLKRPVDLTLAPDGRLYVVDSRLDSLVVLE